MDLSSRLSGVAFVPCDGKLEEVLPQLGGLCFGKRTPKKEAEAQRGTRHVREPILGLQEPGQEIQLLDLLRGKGGGPDPGL